MATPPKPDPPKPDPLSERREKNMNDDFFETPVCPCEEVEPEPQTEYDVPGEWVTYTGEVNLDIFTNAAWEAKDELEREIRAYANAEHTELSSSSEGFSPVGSAPGQQVLELYPRSEQALNECSRREHPTDECSQSQHVNPQTEHALNEYAPSAPSQEELSEGEESELLLIPDEEVNAVEADTEIFDMEAKDDLETEIKARPKHTELHTELYKSSEGFPPAGSAPGPQVLDPIPWIEQALNECSRGEHPTDECSQSQHVNPPSEHALNEYAPSAPSQVELSQFVESGYVLLPNEATMHSDDEGSLDFMMDMGFAVEPRPGGTGAVVSNSRLRSAEGMAHICKYADTSSAEVSSIDAPIGEAAAGNESEFIGAKAAASAPVSSNWTPAGSVPVAPDLTGTEAAAAVPVGSDSFPAALTEPEPKDAEAAQPQLEDTGAKSEALDTDAAGPAEDKPELQDVFSEIPSPVTPDEWDAEPEDEYITVWEQNWADSDQDYDPELKQELQNLK